MKTSSPPLFVYPTRHCNFACSYCFTDSHVGRNYDTVITRNWRRLLREATSCGVPELRISGGEPLLIPRVRAMMEAVNEAGMTYSLTTNGSRLTRNLNWLTRSPPSTLWISYHEEHTTLDRFLELVSMATAKLASVGANLFDEVINSHDDVIGRLVEAGVSRIKILRLTPIGRASNLNLETSTIPSPNHGSTMKGKSVEIRAEIDDLGMLGPHSCVIRHRQLPSIDHNGKVYACCVTLGVANRSIGVWPTDSLKSILHFSAGVEGDLPCNIVLPEVKKGIRTCPLHLTLLK